ncbi:MAG: Rhomboid family protein [Acidimicrobiales bacterium]|nr:Rhomboid family protein [Acidimicrobiales bacterium]
MSGETPERPELGLPGWLRPFVIVGLLAALMWVVEIVDLLPRTDFDHWGVRPRDLDGLTGIVASPFLHSGFPHLISNTIPFLVLGGIIAASGVVRFLQVTAMIALVSGLGTWLIGPADIPHVGASGIVFGYVTYLVARGLFERRAGYLLVGAAVVFLYGGVLWGLIPRPGISWQMHLFGAIGGILAAKVVHTTRQPRPDEGTGPVTAW